MHDPSLERIRELERAVRRWRLLSLALLLLFLSAAAVGATFAAILVLSEDARTAVEEARAQAHVAQIEATRANAEVARLQALLRPQDPPAVPPPAGEPSP